MTGENDRLLLRPDEVARELGYSRSKVYELIAAGAIPSVRFGERGVRVPREALRRLLDDRSTPVPA